MIRAIENLRSTSGDCAAVALYTCSKTVVLVGVLEQQLFAVDTHGRIKDKNGEKTGCLVVFDKHPNDVQHLSSWLLKGQDKGVGGDELQSFPIMR